MAETPVAEGTDTKPEVTPPADSQTPQKPEEGQEPKGDLNVAVHQARQEAKAERDRTAAAEQRVQELEQRLKEADLSSLPEDEQIDEGFVQLTQEKVFAQVDQEQFAKLPTAIRNRLKENPWSFVSEEAIKQETKFASSRPQYYQIIGKMAVDSIKELLAEAQPSGETQPSVDDQKDPSVTDAKPADPIQGYTEAEFRMLTLQDPVRAKEILKSLKQR